MGDMVVIDEQVFTDIADAIRDRNGEETTYKPREMAEAVENLHNVRPKKWVRPSDWPDYSKVQIADDEEVIYLTYDCTYDGKIASFVCQGNYTVARGSLINGTFTATSTTNVSSGVIFEQSLPTNEGNYVVYKITPQSSVNHLTNFRFKNVNDPDSSSSFISNQQPCVERYANVPNMTCTWPISTNNDSWSTRYIVSDTIKGAIPNGSISQCYNNGGFNLEHIDYSECSFKNVTNMSGMFYNQYEVKEIYLPHDLSNKCTVIGNVFYNCFSLTVLDLTGWDTSNNTSLNYTFAGCRELIEIKGIEDFDVSSVTNLSQAFNGCYMLRDLDVSKWETTTALTNISSCFRDLRQLKSIDVSKFITNNVTNFEYCFAGMMNLRELDVSNWSITSSATTLAGFIGYCRSLRSFIRTKNWNTSNVTSFLDFMRECKYITEIDLSDFDFSKATTVKYMFGHCNTLRKIKATINLTSVTAYANVQDFVSNCWMLEDLSELTITNCTFMPGFAYDYAIKTINIPSSVSTIRDNALRDMNHCRLFNFSNHASVPTLNAATDITNGMNAHTIIKVPTSLYSTWIASTNWSNASIRPSIISASDYDYYNSSGSTFTNIDLSQCTWVKNSSYSGSAAVGTAYASTVGNGSGNRICSGLIDLPANTTVFIHFNDGYQVSFMSYDASGNYLKIYKDWLKNWYFINNSTIKKIALFIRYGDGTTALLPENWSDSGITISYAS